MSRGRTGLGGARFGLRRTAALCAALLACMNGQTRAGPEPTAVLSDLLSLLRRQNIAMDPQVLSGALAEAVVRAADPGGAVLTEEAFVRLRDQRRGLRRSAGVSLEWNAADGLVVADVPETSAAYRTGLVTGAVLDSVDGRFVAGRGTDEVLRWLDEGTGENLTLTVRFPGEPGVRTLDIGRTVQQQPSIAAVESWPRGLAYLRLNGLYDDGAPSVAARLRAWQEEGRFGIVLDLRGAGGERVDAAAALAGLLSERSGDASLLIEALDGTAVEEFMAVAGERIRLPTMVLIDERTGGASELLAVVLRAVDRGAMLIGSRTSGDCGLREALPFGDQQRLYLRTRRVLLNGADLCGDTRGAEPHIRVPADEPAAETRAETPPRGRPRREHDEEREDRALRARVHGDTALQRAVDVLLGLRAIDLHPAGDGGKTP